MNDDCCCDDLGSECPACEVDDSSNEPLNVTDINYLISRLEQIKEHINYGNYHMASTKLMADINALSNIADTTGKTS